MFRSFFVFITYVSVFTCKISAISNPVDIVDAANQYSIKLPYYRGLDTSFLQNDTHADLKTIANEIIFANPEHNEDEIFKQLYWNLSLYNRVNKPLVVGEISDKELFSSKLNGHGLRFLDLPIYMPNQGWRIPVHLKQFEGLIRKVVMAHKLVNSNFEKDHFVYITVDQGIVAPKTSQRRAGWHADSYRKINTFDRVKSVRIPVDYVYVVSNCCPTIFVHDPISLKDIDPENIDEVLLAFSKHAQRNKQVVYPDFTILRVDPYCIHDSGRNEGVEPIERTFVKISFSKTKYCKLGNAHNQLFIYDWPMVPRYGVKYTIAALKESSHRKDGDQFSEVKIEDNVFLQNDQNVEGTSGNIFFAVNNNYIIAKKAEKNDQLKVENQDFHYKYTLANDSDWRVSLGDEFTFYLDESTLFKLYRLDQKKSNRFIPNSRMLSCIEVLKPIRFRNPKDGVLEYADVGDIIVRFGENELHTVPKELFFDYFKTVK